MSKNKGYILLESVVSLGVILIIMTIIYSLSSYTFKANKNISDKVEVHQQGIELTKYMEDIIQSSYGVYEKGADSNIIEVDPLSYKSVSSIVCKYYVEDSIASSNKLCKEIYLNKNTNKIFIRNIENGIVKGPGYEIGNYVDNMYVNISESQRIVNIILDIKKNNEKDRVRFTIFIEN